MSNLYQCKYCNKYFKKKGNMKRHINNNSCKKTIIENHKNNIDFMINTIQKLTLQIDKINNRLNICESQNEELKSQIKFLLSLNKVDKKVEINNVSHSNLTIDNSDKQYITINIYTQEKGVPNDNSELLNNIEKLSKDKLLKYLIHYKHLKLPENRNIYINKNECQVKRLKGWKKESCDKFLKGEFMKNMTKHMIEINLAYLYKNDKTNKNLVDLFESNGKIYFNEIKNFLNKNNQLVEESKEQSKE